LFCRKKIISHFSLSAATPSYFFQPPPQAGHHNFFFSELLRSLVQKRKADELNAAMKAKSMTKKVRKPVYHPQIYQKPPQVEQEWKKQKLNDENVKVTTEISEGDLQNENSQDSVINVDKDDPPVSTATTLATPSLPSLPNSAFYPYVDPLHFFIDLRVSAGQIYDRKKEAYLQQALNLKNNNILLDSTWNNPIIGRNRANSAFKVPGEQAQNFNAINLIQSDAKKNFKRDDDFEKNEEEVQIFDLDKNEK
jgi:hypothetical protein